MKRAQTSIEFVILMSFMILAFMVFYIMIQSKLVEANRDETDRSAKQIETILVNELKVAESVTDGYYREFELPQRINGLEYNASIMAGAGNTPEIVVKYSGKERVYFIYSGYVSDSSTVGKGRNNITKNGGVILVRKMS